MKKIFDAYANNLHKQLAEKDERIELLEAAIRTHREYMQRYSESANPGFKHDHRLYASLKGESHEC